MAEPVYYPFTEVVPSPPIPLLGEDIAEPSHRYWPLPWLGEDMAEPSHVYWRSAHLFLSWERIWLNQVTFTDIVPTSSWAGGGHGRTRPCQWALPSLLNTFPHTENRLDPHRWASSPTWKKDEIFALLFENSLQLIVLSLLNYILYYHLDPEIMAFHGLVNSGSVWRLVPVIRQEYGMIILLDVQYFWRLWSLWIWPKINVPRDCWIRMNPYCCMPEHQTNYNLYDGDPSAGRQRSEGSKLSYLTCLRSWLN